MLTTAAKPVEEAVLVATSSEEPSQKKMATPTPPSESSSSYTMLDTSDVEAIGAHCAYTYCHQLDFLPFRCQSCNGKFCLDHRTEDGHDCSQKGAWARKKREAVALSNASLPTTQKPTLATSQQCSDPSCKTFVNTSQNLGVQCSTCNRTYCLKHRFPEEHNCKNLIPIGARPIDTALRENREKLRQGFGKLKLWSVNKQQELGKSIQPKPKPTSKAAQVVALNQLKKTATGDASVPNDKRIYLHCSATEKVTKDGKPKEAALWFSQDWKVGRLLDVAANKLAVANVNNSAQSDELRLRVYHVESGEVLEFSEKTGQRMVSGNSIVLIRGLDMGNG